MGIAKSKIKSLAGKVFSGIAVFAFAFFASYLSSSHFAPVSESEAASSTYYASISSSESIDITLQSTPDGVYKVGKDSLSIDTNSTVGYKLYISTIDHSSDNNGTSLPSTTPANGLIDSATGAYISPSSGTVDTPVRLGTNTWGYTVSRSSSSESSTSYVDSDAAPTEAKGGKAVWRAVPEYGNEDIFYVNSSPATSSTNSVDVYYAVNASTALPSGTYSNTVVYTAIVEGNVPTTSSSDLVVSPNYQGGLDAGNEVTISTGLYPGFSVENLGVVEVKIGGSTCTSPAMSIDNTNGNLVITCTTPASTAYGSYNVTIALAKNGEVVYTNTLTDGYKYVPKFYAITTMQEMAHEICTDSSVVTPNLTTMSNVITRENYTPSATGTPETVLEDVRDRTNDEVGTGTKYTIRKFGDGKCWMARNLRYAPTTATTLSPETSDIIESTAYIMPANGATTQVADSNEVYEGEQGQTYDTMYYSWYTATAGTGLSSMSSNNNVSVSICPKNWRLPTGNNGVGTSEITYAGSQQNLVNGDYYRLDMSFGGNGSSASTSGYTAWTNSKYGFGGALLGFMHGATEYDGGNRGLWWTSTANGTKSAYLMDILGSYVNPVKTDSASGNSFAIRCVAR